ncbi:glutaredoxin-C6-like [Rutidosis leptorrhynchoides]|uniref:glutaredoxin-C6-like n=1 Tax=Rutidosis leptorrhynchoides TaxID=125765 RepID=UPI003A993D43
MQGVHGYRNLRSDGGVRLELSPTTNSPLAIDVSESTEMRIQRLITENPVIIFSRSACCMCHVMKRLFASLSVHPTVIELEEDEIGGLSALQDGGGGETVAPAVFIGGERVGGLESLVGLHLSGQLVPKLVDVGVLVL